MELKRAQTLMLKLYDERDKEREVECTFIWLVEEVGEYLKLFVKGMMLILERSLPIFWLGCSLLLTSSGSTSAILSERNTTQFALVASGHHVIAINEWST